MAITGREISKVETRVQKGIKWLDKNIGRSKWLKKIRLNKLNLAHSNTCIIGEVLGDYSELEEQYSIEREDAAKMAFNTSYDEDFDCEDRNMELLTSVWYSTLKAMGAKK